MLNEILNHKREEVAYRKRQRSLQELKAKIHDGDSPRGFQEALQGEGSIRLIAEIKKASPSKGVIRTDFDPLGIAEIYAEGGAQVLSVLTDEQFFQGHLDLLSKIKKVVSLPLLQKDFILSDYQVYEARAHGADAILLIVAVLDPSQLKDYHALAWDLGMGVLCEVHSEKELETVLDTAPVIGINNRDLKTFKTDLETTFRVKKEIPPGKTVVSESGINARRDVLRLQDAGVDAMLVGESLMREKDMAAKLRELLQG